jgi:hypothetical protein
MRKHLAAGLVVLVAYLAAGTAEERLQPEPDPIESLQSPDSAQRFAARSRIVQERRSLVQSLVKIARGGADDTPGKRAQLLRLTSPKCLAIKLLGELRAEEAVPSLVQDLTYRVDTSIAGTFGGRGLGARYPAAGSLAKIGNPAVPKLLGFLGKSTERVQRHVCVWTLIAIDGRDVARFRVERAIERCGLSRTKANLEAGLEYFDKEDLDFAPPEEPEKPGDK